MKGRDQNYSAQLSVELRLWCSNRSEQLSWFHSRGPGERGIPHYGQKPLALRQRTEPPASTRKAQSVSAGKMGGGGRADLGNLM